MSDPEYLSWGYPDSWRRLQDAVASNPRVPPADHLRKVYLGLVAFHACCIESINSYKLSGLRPISLAEHHANARAIAAAIRPGVLPSQVDRAIALSPKPRIPAALYATLDHRELEAGNSFSRFGSEHLHNVLNRVAGFTADEVGAYLEGRGTPSIIEFRLPWNEVCEYALENVQACAESVLEDLGNREEHRTAHWTHYQETAVPWSRVIKVHTCV